MKLVNDEDRLYCAYLLDKKVALHSTKAKASSIRIVIAGIEALFLASLDQHEFPLVILSPLGPVLLKELIFLF